MVTFHVASNVSSPAAQLATFSDSLPDSLAAAPHHGDATGIALEQLLIAIAAFIATVVLRRCWRNIKLPRLLGWLHRPLRLRGRFALSRRFAVQRLLAR
jgi:hypothetical protein